MSEKALLDQNFEIGRLYVEKCDFPKAVKKLELVKEEAIKTQSWDLYLKSIQLLLRLYVEMDQLDNADDLKEQLQDLILKEKISLNSRTYYTLALCAFHKRQYKTSLEYLEKALALALSQDNKEDACYAISGLAIVYKNMGRLEDALKEIYNLQVFFQVIPLPEIEVSSYLLNGMILKEKGQYDQALDIYWKCYDRLKENKNFYQYIILLHSIGEVFRLKDEKQLALTYLSLAKRACDPKSLRRFYKKIQESLEELGEVDTSKYDLVFKAKQNTVVEKKKGVVHFKNQFILLDMLKLFLQHPGQVYSKEDIVKHVWKQEYDPNMHDNKIYVTIKRLRKLIEPDFDKPKYIFRAKNGYYLNREIKVLLDQ
ncbi:MAG: hypothetical protein D6797_04195 [Bdellovibrio sp.]|nr:MAG: hypothetical protein D6797_04195 [Bdellovibrio sp.]